MVNISFLSDIKSDSLYVKHYFYKDNKALEINSPLWGMSLRNAGNMRFRWNEKNILRDSFLSSLAKDKEVVPVELIHSKIICDVVSKADTINKTADGIITTNAALFPVITVADCMPIFLYDSVSKVFGVLHSGWKGTGIVAEAIKLAEEKYNAHAEDFSVAIGPHIGDCCYIVDEERAEYFSSNFTEACIEKVENDSLSWNDSDKQLYKLSLTKANLSVLRKLGVKDSNIVVCDDCTCSSVIENTDFYPYGSYRRESKGKANAAFTVQAAFCAYF
ncbi:MAG: polyphenol oxidase family protein [Treponema sp.]|nr:polyphenol oxidase family protein [Treponema sp.]